VPGSAFVICTEVLADGQQYQWNAVCGACVKAILAQNSAYDRGRREREQAVERRALVEAERSRLLAAQGMRDIDASNRSNSRSYIEATQAMQADVDAAMREWGMGGSFPDPKFPAPQRPPTRRLVRR